VSLTDLSSASDAAPDNRQVGPTTACQVLRVPLTERLMSQQHQRQRQSLCETSGRGRHGPAGPGSRERWASEAALGGRRGTRSAGVAEPSGLDLGHGHGHPRRHPVGDDVSPPTSTSSWTQLGIPRRGVAARTEARAVQGSGHGGFWLPWRWGMNVAAYVARSRAAQGLGARISDPVVLNRIALLLAEAHHAVQQGARASSSGQLHLPQPGMRKGREAADVRGS
jgi:hypothetical protein